MQKWQQRQLIDYLENGNITHSVNYPDCDMGIRGENNEIIASAPQCTEYDRPVYNDFGKR